tara:strand:- start:1845 stop:2012 length:168 start_codon:yes stop_codon:yes gene_type:complete
MTKFIKNDLGDPPLVVQCECENITIEKKLKDEEEKSLFLVTFVTSPPALKIREEK